MSERIETNPSERGVIRAGNFELGYCIEGVGKPALVIGSSVYYPRTFSAELRRELKLVFMDHKGFARPTGAFTKSEYELDAVLADIELVRQQLELEDVVVIGHSGHGYMALEYAKKYPQQVSHVVVIAMGPSHSEPHVNLTEQQWQEAVCPQRKAQLERDLKLLGGEIHAAPEKRFITFCIRLGAKSWYDYSFDATPLWAGVAVNMEIVDYLWGEVFRDLKIEEGLGNLDTPVFLALGRFDYLVAPYLAWEPYRASFRDLTVRVFDASSHTPQLEESEVFDQELLSWLREGQRVAARQTEPR